MLLAHAIPLSHSSLHKRWRGSSYPILLWLLYQHRYLDGLISLAFSLAFIMKRCFSLEHTSELFLFSFCSNQLKEERRGKRISFCQSVCLCGVKPWQDVYSRDLVLFNGSLFSPRITGKEQQNVFVSQTVFLSCLQLQLCARVTDWSCCVHVHSDARAHRHGNRMVRLSVLEFISKTVAALRSLAMLSMLLG